MDKGVARRMARAVLDAPLAASTQRQYDRAGRMLDGQHWRAYAESHELRPVTVTGLRAAWRRATAAALLEAVGDADKGTTLEARREARGRMDALAQALLDDEADRQAAPAVEGRRQGKRGSLSRLPADWRARLVEAMPVQDRAAVAVMSITGARPAEMRSGVTVEAVEGGRLRVTIQGAKLTAGTGQPWRIIEDDPRAALGDAGADLYEHVVRSGGTITVTTDLDTAEGSHALQDRIRRAAARAGLRGVSAYSLRHQAAADLKGLVSEGAITGAEASAALGHAAERTRMHYGHAGQSRRGGRGDGPSIEAARDVRPDMRERGPVPGAEVDTGPEFSR